MNEVGLPGIPDHWVLTNLQDCAEILDSRRIPINATDRETRQGNIPYYGATGQVGWIDDFIFNEELVLLGEDGAPFLDPFKSKAYVIRGKSWVNNHAHVLKAITGITLNSFLCSYLNTVDYHGYVTGTTRLKLNQAPMRGIPVPLPPLPEQHRIIAKIEELFTKLDAGIEALKKVKAQLKRYRQAVLKYALEGKLTQEWREANKHKLEPAAVLIKRIKEEREKRAEGKFQEFAPVDTADLPELPKGWVWTRAGDICEGIVPGRTKPKKFEGKIPWITLPDVKGLYVSKSLSGLGVLKEDAEKVGMKIMPSGTVLMSCVGQFGIICIAKLPVVPNQQFHGFICQENIIPEFIAYSLMIQIEQMNRLSTPTTIAYMNKTKCNSVQIPLAPFLEQKLIVEEIERRLSLADEVEKLAEQTLKQSERLRQSILKTAFEGKLVPQDPTDEPAEKLLERIKNEKLGQEKKGKIRLDRGKEYEQRT